MSSQPELAQVCAAKLQDFVTHEDPNLKYLGLLALAMLQQARVRVRVRVRVRARARARARVRVRVPNLGLLTRARSPWAGKLPTRSPTRSP